MSLFATLYEDPQGDYVFEHTDPYMDIQSVEISNAEGRTVDVIFKTWGGSPRDGEYRHIAILIDYDGDQETGHRDTRGDGAGYDFSAVILDVGHNKENRPSIAILSDIGKSAGPKIQRVKVTKDTIRFTLRFQRPLEGRSMVFKVNSFADRANIDTLGPTPIQF